MSSMKSNQVFVPDAGGVEGTNSFRENCCRNKRKFLLEAMPSLRNTVQGSSKVDKQPENGEDSISNSNSIQDLQYGSNSVDSDNLQSSYHQEQASSISEAQAQKPEELLCHHAHYVSDQDTRAEIPVRHGQLRSNFDAQAGNWDNDTEHQLEELLMKYLESICSDAIKKVVSYGYDVDEARKAVLRVASCYNVRDSLSSFGEKALVYLSNKSKSHETEPGLSDFKELHKFMLAEMVRVLRDVRRIVKTGDALWCLIVNDMNISQACGMQDLLSSSTDASSSFNSSAMPLPSAEACLPAALTSSQLQCNTTCQPLNAIATKSFVHPAENPNAAAQQRRTQCVQTSSFPRDNGSDFSVPLPDGRSQSSSLTCVERLGKEHKNMPVSVNSDVLSLNNLHSATSLCGICSICCHEDTTLSIGPPVRLVAEPGSLSKITTEELLGSSFCKEGGKNHEGWQMSSTSSVGQPTISKTQQNSLLHFGELSLPQECTSFSSCSKFPPSDLDYMKQKHLARGASHPINQNVRLERLQSSVISGKTSHTSSPRASNQTQLPTGAARVNGCSLTAAGKELSLAIASAVHCSKMDAPSILADETISDSNSLQKEFDLLGVPDSKAQLLEELLQRVKDLEATLQERSKWAREKVAHAAKRLINDFSELKALRLEREEVSRLKKEKQALEDSSKKKISDMETAFRKAIGQAECTNAAVRRLEIQNAEMRAEMEAAKLSAAESSANDKVVAKREKQARKKEKVWEKQRAKLQEEITSEKRKLAQLQLDLLHTKEQQEAAEERWKQEVKAKEVAINLEESGRRAKEKVEAAAKKSEDSIRRKAKADDRRHQDDIARLEDEIAHLSLSKNSLMQNVVGLEANTGVTSLSKYTCSMQDLRNINSRLLQELADVQSPSSRELQRDRECVMCMSEERSIVFLPCAHQVICVDCNDLHETQGMKDCPSCRTSIEQRIRVYGTNA